MNKHASMSALAILSALAITGCSSGSASSSDSLTLKIYNCADYIGETVVEDFKAKVKEEDGVDLNVIYETFDTNEVMLSQFEIGSSSYDLVCPSDYMIQRMMANGMLIPFASGEDRDALYVHGTDGWDDNYSTYASRYLQSRFDSITSEVPGKGIHTLSEYARGYMWGTLGILYNPAFNFSGKGEKKDEDEIKFEMNDWNTLWDSYYKGSFQIKDSMRDTYSMGVMRTYDELFVKLSQMHSDGTIDDTKYNEDVATIFNNVNQVDAFNELASSLDPSWSKQSSTDIVNSVKGCLSSLRDNSYGLEVDSGKTDILTGSKSGIQLTWSGDAVYSIEEAEEAYNNILYYSIPETGGNIWFDGWVIPSTCTNQEYAQKFIDYLSDPEVAAENMDYIGYTPFIAGDTILDQVRTWYDPRTWYIYAYDETADDYCYDEEENPMFNDGTGTKEIEIDGETHVVEFGDSNMEGSTFEAPCIDGVTSSSWDEIADEEGWSQVGLTYFFDGSLEDYSDGVDDIFYSSEIEEVTETDKDGNEKTINVGRGFYAQYPPNEIIPSLAVMEDYGDNNAVVLKMWEDVKSGSIPSWIIIVLCVEVSVALGVGLYFFVNKSISKNLRRKRRESRKAA